MVNNYNCNMTSLEITTIFFDIGKVLLDFDHTLIWQRLASFSELSPEHIQQQIQGAGLMEQHEIGQLPPAHFFQEVQQQARLSPSLPYQQFCGLWSDIFEEKTEMLQLASALQARYSVGFLSNVGELHWDWVARSYPLFSDVEERLQILSFRVRASKPEHAIYEEAILRSQSKPEQCVYVDDIHENVQAGQKTGMHSIRYQSTEQVKRELREMGMEWFLQYS